MLPLPPKPFLLKYTKEITINSTYHFQVDKNHFYSVPYQHIGKKAKVIYDAEKVEVWIGLDRIAAHDRKHSDGYTTVESHMPEEHIAYKRSKEINAACLLSKASQVAPPIRVNPLIVSLSPLCLYSRPTVPAKVSFAWPENTGRNVLRRPAEE